MATFTTKFGIGEDLWVADECTNSVCMVTTESVYMCSDELPVYEIFEPGCDVFSVSEDVLFHTKEEADAKLQEMRAEKKEREIKQQRQRVEYFEHELEKSRNRLRELEDGLD